MSCPLTSPEEAAAMLRLENYNVDVVNGLLIARDIPYVSAEGAVERGVLAFPVEFSDGDLRAGSDHTAFFLGSAPYDAYGTPLDIVANPNVDFDIPSAGRAKLQLSRRKDFPSPSSSGYATAREKLEAYIAVVWTPAHLVNPHATARTGNVPSRAIPSGPFHYPDSASARVGIGHMNATYQDQRIGIIGLGGTGSYILDFIAKTHVPEIHLFDGDVFRSHNAFRAPGAASKDDVERGTSKAEYFANVYGVFRDGIVAHPQAVSPDDTDLLKSLSFVFLAVDNEGTRRGLASLLESLSIPYVDVGMGALIADQDGKARIVSQVRTTFWRPGMSSPTGDRQEAEDAYESNIQIAELNALNATLAVIRWKKHINYYQDLLDEAESIYSSNVQQLSK
jgi:hypothetical protein